LFTNLIKNVGKKRKKIYFVLSENEIQTYKYTEILKFLHENDLVLPKNEKCYVHKYDVNTPGGFLEYTSIIETRLMFLLLSTIIQMY
jgi:hypothetical protein